MIHTQPLDNIAIIGFLYKVPFRNKVLAFLVGFLLACKGYSLLAGNINGTFKYAFYGAKLAGGKTIAIIEKNEKQLKLQKEQKKVPNQTKHFFLNEIHQVDSKNEKHFQIATQSRAAIVIGGGKHSLHLVKTFLQQGKTVVAIVSSGGIVDIEIQEFKVVATDLLSAVTNVIK